MDIKVCMRDKYLYLNTINMANRVSEKLFDIFKQQVEFSSID